jgi:GNAT superfamily N-acetyltransferase
MSDLELSYEGAADVAAITRTVAAAFGQKAEAELVSALREAGALTLSLVARLDGEVVGHVALSPVAVAGRQADDWLGLAPLAVAPAHQRIGIGSALARRALELAAVRGAAPSSSWASPTTMTASASSRRPSSAGAANMMCPLRPSGSDVSAGLPIFHRPAS